MWEFKNLIIRKFAKFHALTISEFSNLNDLQIQLWYEASEAKEDRSAWENNLWLNNISAKTASVREWVRRDRIDDC